MSDRVPICTIPGVISALVDVDVMVAPADVAKLITRIFVQRTDNLATGEVTLSIRNATGGGGEGISVTLGDNESEATASGSITVEATEPAYIRVSAADAFSENLRGWFEVDGAAGVTAALTSLARVEQFLGADTGHDDLINNLVAAVSGEIQGWLDRQIVQATATDERIDSIGDAKIHTRFYPIISITSLSEDSVALTEDTDFECKEWDKREGALVRISGGEPISWAVGRRIVTTTYSHGYATVPDAITQAATELVVFDYLQSPASGKARFGLSSSADPGTGASSAYTTRRDLWEAIRPRLAWYRRLWF